MLVNSNNLLSLFHQLIKTIKMKKTITKQLQEMMSDYVSDVEMQKLEGIFKAFENLEISRYRSAYATGRCDVITFAKRSTDQFINENYETNE